MEIDKKVLYSKMLQYWNEHDGKDFDDKSLRENFTADELACILYDSYFEDLDYSVINRFTGKIKNIDGLFTREEAERLVPLYPESNSALLKLCSDEFLFSMLSVDNEILLQRIVRCVRSDEVLLKIFDMVKDPYLKAFVLREVRDSDLKMKYLWKIIPSEKYLVITSLDDDYLIEKYISLFKGNKATLISSLKDDKKKAKYLKRYFAVISKDDRADIIKSFEDDNIVLHYLKYVGDYVKGEVIKARFHDKPEIIEKIIVTIKNKSVLADLLKFNNLPEELTNKYIEMFIDRITNQEDLEDIICNSNDVVLLKYFTKLSYKRRLERIKSENHPQMRFRLLKFIDNPSHVITVIQHTDSFPEYSDEFDYLIDICANYYKVNRERLMALVKNVSFSVLTYLDNENIIKILNSKVEEFNLLLEIFDKESLKMDQSSMNDILNTMLQRQFRLSSPEIIMIFPLTLNAIDSGDIETIRKNIDTLANVVNLEEEIVTYGWNKESFITALLNKDGAAIDFLHVLTAKYIRNERSVYVQNNLTSAQNYSTDVYCDKNDFMKFLLNTYPVEYIMSCFGFYGEAYEEAGLTLEEFELLKNKELLKKIIEYKKNPRAFDRIPEDVKNNMKIFSSVFEKRFADIREDRYFGYSGRMSIEYKKVDEEFLANILMYIDIDKLRKDFFSNPELIDKFMKFWKQYKIGGWGNTFKNVLTSAGVVVDPEIVANFVQYFGLSYEQLEEKKEKKEISSISLTALLDLAACYSVGSQKYSLLFGEEDFKLLSSNPGPNSSTWSKDRRLSIAIDLINTIRKRKYVTVPPVDQDFELPGGKNMNVVVGNFSNMMNLTYGERTGACMRIGGAGKSLFDFCLREDSGFHIRFVNPDTGKFVSRVSGFRNGNTVFLNELRYSEDPTYTNLDVVEACKAVAQELIVRSKNSSLPIDNVVVTPYYSMANSGMKETNLGIKDPQKGMKKFYTDVSSSSIILATSAPNNELVAPNLGIGVPKYDVLRDKKRVLYNREAFSYLAHLQCLDQVMSGKSIENVEVEINENIIVCLAGEDWCVTIDKQGNIDKYLMKNTNNKGLAIDEMQEALNYLKDNLAREMTIATNVLGM